MTPSTQPKGEPRKDTRNLMGDTLSDRLGLPLQDALGRIDVGAYYTNGADLCEVVKVLSVGGVILRNSSTNAESLVRIDTFRRLWWKVRDSA